MTRNVKTFRQLPDQTAEAVQVTVAGKAVQLGLDLSSDTMRDRVLALLETATLNASQYVADGDWYGRAHELATAWSGTFGLPVSVVAGVLAITSPQTSWTRNRLDAHTILTANDQHRDVPTAILAERILDARYNDGSLTTQPRRVIEAALSMIRTHDVLGYIGRGPKVRSFFDNIVRPDASLSVTVDTHMIRALLDDPDMEAGGTVYRNTLGCKAPQRKADGYTDGLYPWFAQPIADAAKVAGILPHQAQAIAWCQWRRAQGAWGGTVDRDPVYLNPETIRALLA